MKKFLQWCLIFFVSVLVTTGIFFLLMHVGFLKGISVLMYRGIVVMLICCIIMSGVLVLLWKFVKLPVDGKDIFIFVLGFLCANMVFFTLVPVTVERSVSVFMLSYMDHENEISKEQDLGDAVFTKADIEKVFNEKYVQEFGAFEKRFEEQVVTGTIEEKGSGYVLTDRGRFIVGLFRAIGEIFDTDRRLLFTE